MATPIPDNRAAFDADEIRAATGALGDGAARVEGVVLDSRRVKQGQLFVALRGENHDAHDYLPQVVEAGAAAVIVDREVDVDGVDVWRVDDTLVALGALASHHRSRHGAQLVGITGSVGKTTTKELLAAALRGAGRTVLATEGNLNNRIGVPMTLFCLEPQHDTAVIEMGMNVPGEIATLTAMAKPDAGVVTAVAAVHTEGVGGIDGVAREKGALLEGLGEDAVAVWCADEPRLAPYAERSPAARKVGYGRDEDADVRLASHTLDEGTRYRVQVGDASHDGTLQLLGGAAAINATGALAVISAWTPERLSDAMGAMAALPPRAQRMAPVQAGELLVIDDTYNASPRSTVAALETGAQLAEARGGRLVAVLADMLELGRLEEQEHTRMGEEAVRLGAHALLLHGERMSAAAKGALRAMTDGVGPRLKVRIFADADLIAEAVHELTEPGDVVLVKGSRGMRMERVVDALTEVAA